MKFCFVGAYSQNTPKQHALPGRQKRAKPESQQPAAELGANVRCEGHGDNQDAAHLLGRVICFVRRVLAKFLAYLLGLLSQSSSPPISSSASSRWKQQQLRLLLLLLQLLLLLLLQDPLPGAASAAAAAAAAAAMAAEKMTSIGTITVSPPTAC